MRIIIEAANSTRIVVPIEAFERMLVESEILARVYKTGKCDWAVISNANLEQTQPTFPMMSDEAWEAQKVAHRLEED